MSQLDFITPETWCTSDHHWNHENIRGYQNRPADHFARMRRRWLETVQPDETLLHLGDIVCFGDRKRHPYWIGGLPGRKFLLKGNHDYHEDSWYEGFGFTVLGREPRIWIAPDGRIVVFSHEPVEESDEWEVNVHGHLHGNAHREVPVGGKYRNVSVEVTNYAPVRLRDLL